MIPITEISDHVRNLLLDVDFLTSILGSPIDENIAKNHASSCAVKNKSSILESKSSIYSNQDREQAKYILLHLDEMEGLFDKEDILCLRNTIKNRLKCQK